LRTPKGHIRQRGGSYEISVPVGRDPVTQRYRYAYDHADSLVEAELWVPETYATRRYS
jgi:hypothetical protein